MKRLFDIFTVLFLLVFFSIPLLLLILFIKVKLGSPVFFTQIRTGLHGRTFKLFKFRSMNNDRDSSGYLLPDFERITKFGQLLRVTSLDELPELWNVLLGEMSLVGPRPLLPEYLPHYSQEQNRRHSVRPGITGWAQINGRNAIPWETKFILDVWYVDNQSLWLDIKIILLTILKVLKREDISQDGEISMKKFIGTNNHNLTDTHK